MPGIVGTIPSAWLLTCHLVSSIFIPEVTPTPRIVGISSAHQQTLVVLFGQDTDVIVTVLLGLSFHKTELGVSFPRVPLDPLLHVLWEVVEADVVDDVTGSYEQGASLLPEQFEVVRMCLVTKECLHIIWKWNNFYIFFDLWSEYCRLGFIFVKISILENEKWSLYWQQEL